MTPTRFQTLLDARGPRIGRWPEADRLGAEALLARSDRARAALAEAEALDRALAALPHEPPAPLLRAAILDIPDREDRGVGRPLGAWAAGRRGLAAGSTAIAASAALPPFCKISTAACDARGWAVATMPFLPSAM